MMLQDYIQKANKVKYADFLDQFANARGYKILLQQELSRCIVATKRINLSFSMDREEDIKVYDILSEQKYKTDYVIRAVLMFQGKRESITKDEIKEAIKEALLGMVEYLR